MRLSQVLVLVTVSIMLTNEALSATTSFNDAQIAKVASPRGSSQRLLRARRLRDEDEVNSEERGLLPKDLARLANYAEELGINVEKAMRNTSYLNSMKKEYALYKALLDSLIKKRKTKKAPSITYE